MDEEEKEEELATADGMQREGKPAIDIQYSRHCRTIVPPTANEAPARQLSIVTYEERLMRAPMRKLVVDLAGFQKFDQSRPCLEGFCGFSQPSAAKQQTRQAAST